MVKFFLLPGGGFWLARRVARRVEEGGLTITKFTLVILVGYPLLHSLFLSSSFSIGKKNLRTAGGHLPCLYWQCTHGRCSILAKKQSPRPERETWREGDRGPSLALQCTRQVRKAHTDKIGREANRATLNAKYSTVLVYNTQFCH